MRSNFPKKGCAVALSVVSVLLPALSTGGRIFRSVPGVHAGVRDQLGSED